jgi:hypothetical protein
MQGPAQLEGWRFYAVTYATLAVVYLLEVQVRQAALDVTTAAAAAANRSAACLGF